MMSGSERSRWLHRVLLVVLGGIVSCLVVACGGGGGDAAGDGTRADGTPARAPSGEPHGTVRYALSLALSNWDTVTAPSSAYTGAVYEGLLVPNAAGTGVDPALAEQWTLTPKRMSLTLREGVTFHDGTPFDARAVKANIEHIKSTPSGWSRPFSTITRVETPARTRVELVLSKPSPGLPNLLASIGGLMVSPKALADKSYVTRPAGTGPYRYVKGESIEGSKVVFEYWPGYAGDFTGPRRLELYYMATASQRADALRSGQVDVASIQQADLSRLKGTGVETAPYPLARFFIHFLDRKNLFKDARVRQAICHATDVESMLAAQYEGKGKIASQFYERGTPGYNADARGYAYDPDKARALMRQAGSPRLSFTFPAYDNVSLWTQVFVDNLRDIGIEATPKLMASGEYFTTFLSGKYPLVYAPTAGAAQAGPQYFYDTEYARDGAFNPLHLEDQELDRIYSGALAATDKVEQNRLWAKMTAYVDAHALGCGFFDNPGVIAFASKRVAGVVPQGFDPNRLRYHELSVTAAR